MAHPKRPLAQRLALFSVLLLAPTAVIAADLLSVYQQARDNDPVLRQAQAQQYAADARSDQGMALLLPSLELQAQSSENRQEILSAPTGSVYSGSSRIGEISRYEGQSYTLSLRQPLYDGGSFAGLRQVQAELSAAELELEAQRQALILRVAEAYLNILMAKDALEVTLAEQEALGENFEAVQQRFDAGLAPITDVHEARARYDDAGARVIEAQALVDDNEQQLWLIIDSIPDRLATLQSEPPLLAPEPASSEHWVELAGANNPQLAATKLNVRAAHEAISQRKAGHYPSLDIVADHTYTDTGGSFGREATDSRVGIELNMSLFEGGLISAQVREAEAERLRAETELELQQRQVIRDTRLNYRNVISGISRVKAQRQLLVSTEAALQATRIGQKAGNRTQIDVLNAQSAYFGAKRDLAHARYQYLLASLRLKKAVGGLTIEDLANINHMLK